jgi:hypothetical protein
MKSIFEKSKPKGNIYFKGNLYLADEKGKATNTGSIPIVVGPEYVWLGKSLSIPLDWEINMEPVGPGFGLNWLNPLNNQLEFQYFCFRTFFGYNKEKIVRLRQALSDATGHFKGSGIAMNWKDASVKTNCQVCGEFPAMVYNLQETLSIFLSYSIRPKKYLFCPKHGRRFFLRAYWGSFFLSFFGIQGWKGTVNRENCRVALANKAITVRKEKIYRLLTYFPLLFLITCLLLVVFFTVFQS